MRSIVVYYSLSGNTDYAAKAIADKLGADLLRLETVTPYPVTAGKFLWGGKDAVMGSTPALKPYTFDSEAYDTVILGMPLWAWSICPPLRTFLTEQKLQGKHLAFFICSMGGSNKKCLAELRTLCDAPDAPVLALTDPLVRKKPEDISAIEAFAAEIIRRAGE